MPSYLDDLAYSTNTETVMDMKSKTIYDARNFTIYQNLKYANAFAKLKPDLSREDSAEWTSKFNLAEQTMIAMSNILQNQLANFRNRMGKRYQSYTDDLFKQLVKFGNTRLQFTETTRVGSLEEVQMKINWLDKMMDKVKGYELMYPLGEFSFEGQVQERSTSVRERQDALKEKFLREMGVDYTILK